MSHQPSSEPLFFVLHWYWFHPGTLLSCKFGIDLSVNTYSTMDERDTFHLSLVHLQKCFKHSGRYQEAQWISNQQVFDEVPSSFLWCLSLYPRRRQSPFLSLQWHSEGSTNERFSSKSVSSINTFHHHLSTASTSAKPHITVVPFKAQQLSLVTFKQLIYSTGLLTCDSPSLLLSASLNFC